MRCFLVLVSLLTLPFCKKPEQTKNVSGRDLFTKNDMAFVKSVPIRDLYLELKSRKKEKSGQRVDTTPPYFSIDSKFENLSNKDIIEIINNKQIDILQSIYGPEYYGKDDRKDLFKVNDENIRKNALGTACMALKSKINSTDNGIFQLVTSSTGLCPEENFFDQKSLAECTVFAIAPDLVITAAHCIKGVNINDYVIVYGFNILNPNDKTPNSLTNKNIFHIKKVIYPGFNGKDFCILQLDRPVPPEYVLRVRQSGEIGDDAKLYVTGYPDGLPLKVAENGIIRDNTNLDWFKTNLDTYHGNSGSPVFNSSNNLVEGILLSGKEDYIQYFPCKRSLVCGDFACDGEDVLRISQIMPEIRKFMPKKGN